MDSVNKILAEFDILFKYRKGQAVAWDTYEPSIKDFIRIALTKIQRDTREETIETVKEVKKEAAYKSTEVLFDKVIDKLKEKK